MSDLPQRGNETSDYSIRIVLSPLRYIRDIHGEDELARILAEAGLTRAHFDDEKTWLRLEQVVGILQDVRDTVGSDEAFKKACVHRMSEAYGPARFALRALSPRKVFELAARNFPLVSHVGRMEIEPSGSSSTVFSQYFGPPEESRLMCLSRQAQGESLPTLWKLPPAQFTEHSCLVRGDSCCRYEYKLFQPRGLLKPIIGGALGAGAALAAALLGPVAIPAGTLWLALPALGFLLGHLVELRRNNRVNLDVAEEMNEELRRSLRDNVEARREIFALHQRQQDWNRRLEEQAENNSRINEEVAERLGSIVTEHNCTLRGVSHDLKNPLTIVYSSNCSLEERSDLLDPQGRVVLEEQKQAIARMRTMINEIIRLVSTDPREMKLRPETVEVLALEDSYRRRLRALVGNRNIRVSVLPLTREAPRRIVVDRMVLDRVVDNLMSNAVKYTERGSIVLELDGKPGFLTVKISDTGRGIPSDEINRIFRPGGSDPVRRAAESHGLGLSVVVRLLDRIGGKLEVMSLAGQGSTFWAHFPERPDVTLATEETDETDEMPSDDPTSRVVTIRRAG